MQPMKKAEILRYWLINNGFVIEAEDLAMDAGMVYQIIIAKPGFDRKLTDAELFIGRLEQIKDNLLFPESLNMQIRRIYKTINGLKSTRLPQYEAKILLAERIYSQLTEIRI